MKKLINIFSKRAGFGFLMVFSTLSLAGTAAYYSVFGLSSLFAGAKTEVIIMASALELAKLVVASYLHNHWSKLGLILKSYLTLGVGILMIITSAGIYGFLTSAYQTTADQLTIIDKQVLVVDMKRDRFSEQLSDYKLEKTQLNSNISELSKGLANNKIQYTDTLGNVITTTSSSTRRVLTSQLNDMKEERNRVSIKMETLTDSITSLDLKVLDMESNNEVAAEIGPLRYMSEITNKPMATIVNWFTLMIVCVFDPLAIAMVLALNKYFGNGRKEEEEEDYYTTRNRMVYNHTMKNQKDDGKSTHYTHNDELMSDKTNIDDDFPIPSEELIKGAMLKNQIVEYEKAVQEISEEEFDWDASEKRMDIIGQNGNDGEHYDSEELIKTNEKILATKVVEENVDIIEKPIYGGFSKPYSDGTALNESNKESYDDFDEDDIKTY